jgi:hypothetical protein
MLPESPLGHTFWPLLYWSGRIDRFLLGIGSQTILTPLEDETQHVGEPPAIGWFVCAWIRRAASHDDVLVEVGRVCGILD